MAHPFTYDHEAMRIYRREGFTILQVARRFGCSTFTASKACRGAVPAINLKREAARRNIAQAIAIGNARVRSARLQAAVSGKVYEPKRRKGLAVPAWAMNAGLAEDYRDLTHNFDEDHAARVCRRLKAEAQRPCL